MQAVPHGTDGPPGRGRQRDRGKAGWVCWGEEPGARSKLGSQDGCCVSALLSVSSALKPSWLPTWTLASGANRTGRLPSTFSGQSLLLLLKPTQPQTLEGTLRPAGQERNRPRPESLEARGHNTGGWKPPEGSLTRSCQELFPAPSTLATSPPEPTGAGAQASAPRFSPAPHARFSPELFKEHEGHRFN